MHVCRVPYSMSLEMDGFRVSYNVTHAMDVYHVPYSVILAMEVCHLHIVCDCLWMCVMCNIV